MADDEECLMDWSNERYVRVYTRDTVTWKLLDWRGKTTLSLLFRKVDRAGVLDVGHDGVLGLAAILELPLEVVEPGIAQLTASRGGVPTIVDTGTAYVIPNFLEAQEAPSSDAHRKRESRSRRRDVALATTRRLLLPAAADVTKPDTDDPDCDHTCHETGQDRHAESQEVTPIRSVPSRSDPEISPSRAIQPTPGDGGQPGSRQPGPRATQQGAATPGQEATVQGAVPAAGNVAEPQLGPTAHRVEHPPSPGTFDPADPYARGRLAEATWRRVSDARIAVAAELGLPEPMPFPAITPGSYRAGFRDLRARIDEEGALAPASCDRVVENAVKQARAKGSIDWLGERLFGDKAWTNARDGIDPSARRAAGAKGDPPPPASPRREERKPPPPKGASPAELAAAMAEAAADPRGAAAAEFVAAAKLDVPSMLKLVAEPRAGPAARAPTDPPTDEKPSRKHRTA